MKKKKRSLKWEKADILLFYYIAFFYEICDITLGNNILTHTNILQLQLTICI